MTKGQEYLSVTDPPGTVAELYQLQRLPMARLAFVLTGSSSFANEIVQEAFLKVHVNWAHIENPGGYLRTAVVNGCRSYHRHQAVVERTPLSPPVHARQLHRELDDALAKLPYRRRAALALRYFCDLPDEDIALALDVTNVEDSLRDYYASTADGLVLPDRVLDSATASHDATVSYISKGPEPRRRAPMLLAAAASIALLAGAGVVVSRSSSARNPSIVSNLTTVTTDVACSVSAKRFRHRSRGNRVLQTRGSTALADIHSGWLLAVESR